MMSVIKRALSLLRPYRADDKAIIKNMLNNRDLFEEERSVESNLRTILMAAMGPTRVSAYREAYESIHRWFITNASGVRDGIYTGSLYEELCRRRANAICKFVRNKKVLDVGCGDGTLSIALSTQGNEVTGIDISPTVIAIAEKNKKRVQCTRVEFKIMSATELNFPNGCFDVVVSTDLVEHLHPEDLLPHLIEVNRVLKNGGCYIISTPNRLSGHAIPLHLKEYTYAELNPALSQKRFYARAFLFDPNAS